jgi:hypothetical protein
MNINMETLGLIQKENWNMKKISLKKVIKRELCLTVYPRIKLPVWHDNSGISTALFKTHTKTWSKVKGMLIPKET